MNLIDVVERLFDQYGYYVLLIGLPLDFIALPIPLATARLHIRDILFIWDCWSGSRPICWH